MTTKSILLVGVGGQGAILTSKILSAALLAEGYDVKMSEIHGMAQRGGSVTTQIKFGPKVYAPNIGLGEADFMLSFEKVEALRWLPYLKKDGYLFCDEYEIYSMPVATGAVPYPEGVLEELRNKVVNFKMIPAAQKAKELGNAKVQNVILLGVLSKVLNLNKADWPKLIARYVPPKVLDLNLKAFEEGMQAA